ncbi:MAG: radical SAM protein [Proteobacteria bacterium]|nr:radical SAM protein [Pseudomonadota bacterium]MCP4918434.1 radical SAM protein [Pseudomonadota bacterium]
MSELLTLRQRLADERGPPFQQGPRRVALLYPSPYRAGMSSLGFQWIHQILADAGFAVERAFLPDDPKAWRGPLVTYETETPVSHFPVIGVSVAYELELAGLVKCLELCGIPALAKDRDPRHHPRIVAGGPLTFSNPLPLSPFVDAMLLGEADDVVAPAMDAALSEDDWLTTIESLDGGFVPGRAGPLFGREALPAVAKASDTMLPARSRIVTPHAELSDMFLIEGERGCHRQCTFCVMRRSTNGGMRLVTPERVTSLVPSYAKRVGLVGAAISDHPKLVPLLQSLRDAGLGLGISSLRADRVALKPDIARLLREGGYKTLTVASDAASARLRREIAKGTVERHLFRCAELAREHRYRVLKVYMMLGVPGETDDDIDELITFSRELGAIHPVALGIAPLVPKFNTPLIDAGFAGIKTVERRLKRLQRGLQGKVEVRATSARWAWVEAVLAQGGAAEGEALLAAVRAGGRFADYKRAFAGCAALKRLERAA